MPITSLLPIVALVLAFVFLLYLAASGDAPRKGSWVFPAILSVLFFAFTAYTIFVEGLFGVWPEHVQSFWGNQIWFDLLLAVSISSYFLVPKARSLGMRTLPWVLFIMATASIGLLAMLARILYLQENKENVQHVSGAAARA